MVEDYIYQLEGQQKEIMQILHDLFTLEFNLEAKIRYKIPFYFGNTWICYLNPMKEDKVDFAIVRGREISDGNGLLESRGRKMVRSIAFSNTNEIPLDTLREILEEAIFLDSLSPKTLIHRKRS